MDPGDWLMMAHGHLTVTLGDERIIGYARVRRCDECLTVFNTIEILQDSTKQQTEIGRIFQSVKQKARELESNISDVTDTLERLQNTLQELKTIK